MNIDSLGEGKIEMLFDHHLVNNIADLYDLTYDQLYGLEKVISGSGEREKNQFSKEIRRKDYCWDSEIKGSSVLQSTFCTWYQACG